MSTEEQKAKNRERMRLARLKDPATKEREAELRKTPRARWARARAGAKTRASGEKEFTISFEEYEVLLAPGKCHYCNNDTTQEHGSGLDRVDNSKGYLPDNVVLCCGECNRRRSLSMSSEDFKKQTRLNGRWKE